MSSLLLTGLVAGVLMGFVLQRGGLCFHSMFVSAAGGDTRLLRGWLVGVGLGAVGLSIVYLLPLGDGLNRGLPFRPVGNIGGGLLIGVGMAVARSCASGLFYKLGTGMLGAGVGIAGWIAGEWAAGHVSVSGPTVLAGSSETFAGLLGLPRLLVAVVLLVVVVGACLLLSRRETRVSRDRESTTFDGTQPTRRWTWPLLGIGLGVTLVAGWVLAAAGGASYGPSTVGATLSVTAGSPAWWLIAFLVGLVPGGHLGARVGHEVWVRGEQPVRYLQLLAGGVLLGAGGVIAGGCNLGHGLSGAAQLNVASWVAVAAMAAGAVGGRVVLDRAGRRVSPARMSR